MARDLRETAGHAEVAAMFERLYQPGSGSFITVSDADPSPDGEQMAFAACTLASLEAPPSSRIHVVGVGGGDPVAVTAGPADRFPRWAPVGGSLTFISSRDVGRDRAYLLEPGALGGARLLADVSGTVEWTAWSPDATKVLLGVAGCGADRGGAFGSGTTSVAADESLPDWLPDVQSGDAEEAWRRAWVVEVATGEARPIAPLGTNVWEASWAGDGAIVAVVSDAPGEAAWYSADLAIIDLDSGSVRVIVPGASDASQDQIALPAGSPSGVGLSLVRSVCSDRGLVAGDLHVSTDAGETFSPVSTGEVDIAGMAWLDERRLGVVGVRGLHTVCGVVEFGTDGRSRFTETWSGFEAVGPRCGDARFFADGRAVGVIESWDRPPAVAVLGPAGEVAVAAKTGFGLDRLPGRCEQISWAAADGLEIEAILVRPDSAGPHPTLLYVHGGPVYCWRNRWMQAGPLVPLLLERGIAVLMPNPRGSSGRGQAFARPVVGDMGGADSLDLLAGLDHLVATGVSDPNRLAVTGLSYGGFMSSWLITQTTRLAASMPMSPCTDWWSQHYASNIGAWDAWFMGGVPDDPNGPYGSRSPIVHADGVTTPCLFIAGALDKCTPPTQATEMHRALRERGVDSELVIYPEEGHGVLVMPARLDLVTRQLEFLDRFLLGQ